MMEYRRFGSELIEEAYRIYKANGWKTYLGDIEKLKNAFDHSLFIMGGFEDEKLIGFIRCVGDQEYIIYVQDLIVEPSYQRCGIGRKLMEKLSESFPAVRRIALITDEADEVSNAFYQAIGMAKDISGFPVVSYFLERK